VGPRHPSAQSYHITHRSVGAASTGAGFGAGVRYWRSGRSVGLVPTMAMRLDDSEAGVGISGDEGE
jgi:hypothetical protein